MNPQPEYTEVLTFTFGFILIVLYFFADSNNHYKFSDKFTIAEYENGGTNINIATEPVVTAKPPQLHVPNTPVPKNHKPVKKVKRNAARKATPNPKPVEPVRNHNGYTDLQQDCFDSLKSLGIKSVRERKFIVSTAFNKHNPKTVQEFLTVALSRSC